MISRHRLAALSSFLFLISCKSPNSSTSQISQDPANGLQPSSYPPVDPVLGEYLHDGELEAAQRIPQLIARQLREKYANKRILRDAHPKAHGCVNATLHVNPGVRPGLAHGIFKTGDGLKAIVRFSNSNADADTPDIRGDGRGMAIKLLNIRGETFLGDERSTQDFIFINHPVFFISEPSDYVNLIEKSASSNIFSKISIFGSLGFKGAKIASEIRSKKIASPLQSQYFSEVPYQLGVGPNRLAVRYKAEPCSMNGNESIPNESADPDYLRKRLRTHFQQNDACYSLYAQVRTNESMSVEDSREEWDSSWELLATLKMAGKDQNIAESRDMSDPRNVECDNLSFNPWHALPEHKPLGAMNRLRKVIYEHISTMRRVENRNR